MRYYGRVTVINARSLRQYMKSGVIWLAAEDD